MVRFRILSAALDPAFRSPTPFPDKTRVVDMEAKKGPEFEDRELFACEPHIHHCCADAKF
jgi:hypothetical protein